MLIHEEKKSSKNGQKTNSPPTLTMTPSKTSVCFPGFLHIEQWGWSGGAMVLGKLPVPGRPTIWITVGQGPTALAVGAGGVVWTFLLSSILSLLFLPLFGRRPDID